jgi:hypothetical protein
MQDRQRCTRCLASSVSSRLNLHRSCQSLGGSENQVIPHNAGNRYCNHACQVARVTSLIRIEIANCPPYFLLRLFYGRRIGLWILHTMLPHSSDHQRQSCSCPAQYGIGQRWINVGYLCWTRIARGTLSASRLLRSLSVDGSCYVRVALWRTGSWFERSLHVPRKLLSRACQLSLYCSLRHSQHLGCLKDRETFALCSQFNPRPS